jgi:hypothetical protein
MRRHFRRPSGSTLIASIALIVALGGTSYAAGTITSGNIKNGTIRGKDIHNSTITGKKIKNSTLTSGDIKNGSLLAKDFKSAEIPVGPQGPPGADAFGSLTYLATDPVDIPAGEEGVAEADCPAGLFPTGGGALSSVDPESPEGVPQPATNNTINSSFPFVASDAAGWVVFVENQTPDPQTTSAYVICAPAQTIAKSKRSAKKSR